MINLDEYESIVTHWIVFYVSSENAIYFDKFGVKHIPKEITKFVRNKNIITNIYRIQSFDSIICKYFCIGVIDFMLKDRSLFEYTNLFSPEEYKKNGKIYYNLFNKSKW